MTASTLTEVVYEIIPRKVSCDPDEAAEIIAELRAFWRFLGREFELCHASAGRDVLSADGAASELEQALGNAANFGMAKSFVMMGRELGFDMTTKAGLEEFTSYYNASVLASSAEAPSRTTTGRSLSAKERKERKARNKSRQAALAKKRHKTKPKRKRSR